MRSGTFILACFLGLVFARGATAQTAETNAQVNLERFQRTLDEIYRSQQLTIDRSIPANQRMIFEYGGSVSLNLFALDDSNQETHIFRQAVLSAYAHANFDGVHDFLLRLRTSETDFNTGDEFELENGPHDTVEPTIDRAIYTFNLANFMSTRHGKRIDGNVVVAVGRQLVHWANGLSLSQELDGALITLSRKKWALDVVAGVTRDSITDFESSRPSFDNDTNRQFFGGMLTYRGTRHQPFVYGVVQRDRNKDETLLTLFPPATVIPTDFEYNSFYIGAGASGSLGDRLLYSFEAVYEGGEGLSNSFSPATFPPTPIPQTEEDIHAWALDFRLDYLLGGANRSRLSAEVLFASGDDDRGTTSNTFDGNTTGTDDNAFNGFGYIDTGLAFGPNVSNLFMIRVGAQAFPFPTSRHFDKLQTGINLFLLNKLDSDAPIDESTSDDGYIGFEADAFISWQVTSDVTWSLRYGVFVPGEAITTDKDERHFVFTGVTYAF